MTQPPNNFSPPTCPTVSPTDPEAPIINLLAKQNVLGKTPDELRALIATFKTLSQSPVALTARLSREGNLVKAPKDGTKAAKLKSFLEGLE